MQFEAVYSAHFDFVWRSLRRLGVPSSDLADAVQDVFIIVHRRLPSFEERSKLTTWLFRICLHHARDRRDLAYVRHEVSSSPALERSLCTLPDPAERLERAEEHRLIDGALEAMSLEQRVVFVLFELEGFSGREIAALVEAPVATVHSRLRLAREAFLRATERQLASEQRLLSALVGET